LLSVFQENGDRCLTVIVMPRPYGRDIKRWCASDVCLSDICLSRRPTSGLSREQRGLRRLKLAEVAHVTRDSDTTFKVKRSKVNLQGRGIVWRHPAKLVDLKTNKLYAAYC